MADIATNRKALHHFQILERFEAGVELEGTEVKSIRSGFANINNAFARVENNQAYLHGADIQPYERASHEQHEPKRDRRLLLHRKEIDRLLELTATKGLTLVALRLYWKKHLVKLELGVGRGKDTKDRREDIKRREVKRETDREIARFSKGRR